MAVNCAMADISPVWNGGRRSTDTVPLERFREHGISGARHRGRQPDCWRCRQDPTDYLDRAAAPQSGISPRGFVPWIRWFSSEIEHSAGLSRMVGRLTIRAASVKPSSRRVVKLRDAVAPAASLASETEGWSGAGEARASPINERRLTLQHSLPCQMTVSKCSSTATARVFRSELLRRLR